MGLRAPVFAAITYSSLSHREVRPNRISCSEILKLSRTIRALKKPSKVKVEKGAIVGSQSARNSTVNVFSRE